MLSSRFRNPVIRLATLLPALVLSGCQLGVPLPFSGAKSAAWRPTNIHAPHPTLPADCRSVAVLPLVAPAGDADAQASVSSLEQLLHAELTRTRRFELRTVSAAQLRHWAGRSVVTTDGELPVELLPRLRRELGCDAVLFTRVTVFRAYPPLAVGWQMRLVDVHSPYTTLWAADEVFEADRDDLAASRSDRPWAWGTRRPEAAILSPRQFSRRALEAILETLPRPPVATVLLQDADEIGMSLK
jgi:hypothetical protein